MKPELSMLGMGIAFDIYGNADFSNMYAVNPGEFYISKAIHKAYIQVSESGTVATAVTAVGISVFLDLQSPPVIKADHPFLYAIVEKQTGAVLFTGILNDPQKN
jgi:serpin B